MSVFKLILPLVTPCTPFPLQQRPLLTYFLIGLLPAMSGYLVHWREAVAGRRPKPCPITLLSQHMFTALVFVAVPCYKAGIFHNRFLSLNNYSLQIFHTFILYNIVCNSFFPVVPPFTPYNLLIIFSIHVFFSQLFYVLLYYFPLSAVRSKFPFLTLPPSPSCHFFIHAFLPWCFILISSVYLRSLQRSVFLS